MTSFFEKDKFFNWYKGESQLTFPSDQKKFQPKTSALSGRFSTPYFGEIFNEEDFDLRLSFSISIYVPEEIRKNASVSLVIDIDYDIEENTITGEILRVGGSNSYSWEHEKLNSTLKIYKKEFSLQGDESYKVSYSRAMDKSDYQWWKSKRNTGMRVSWYYNDTVKPDKKYILNINKSPST